MRDEDAGRPALRPVDGRHASGHAGRASFVAMTGMSVAANEAPQAEHTVLASPDELSDQTEYDLTLDYRPAAGALTGLGPGFAMPVSMSTAATGTASI